MLSLKIPSLGAFLLVEVFRELAEQPFLHMLIPEPKRSFVICVQAASGHVLADGIFHAFLPFLSLRFARLDGGQYNGFFFFRGLIQPVLARAKEAFNQSGLRGHALLVLHRVNGHAIKPADKLGGADLAAVKAAADFLVGKLLGCPSGHLVQEVIIQAVDVQHTFIFTAALVVGGIVQGR